MDSGFDQGDHCRNWFAFVELDPLLSDSLAQVRVLFQKFWEIQSCPLSESFWHQVDYGFKPAVVPTNCFLIDRNVGIADFKP
jgi:hypothetical protein